MLRKFSIAPYNKYGQSLLLDLTPVNSYRFNNNCIKNDIIRCAMIYGLNGTGKTRLGHAIMAIKKLLNNKINFSDPISICPPAYTADLYSLMDLTTYSYEFLIDSSKIQFEFGKTASNELHYEKLLIYGEMMFKHDNCHSLQLIDVMKIQPESCPPQVSVLAILQKKLNRVDSPYRKVIQKWLLFISKMELVTLFEDTADRSDKQRFSFIVKELMEGEKLQDCREFLKNAGITTDFLGPKNFAEIEVPDGEVDQYANLIYECISPSIKASLIFYYYYALISTGTNRSDEKFLFFDTLDGPLHPAVSRFFLEKFKTAGCQFVITSHDTSLMTNDLLRPDCYFLLNSNGLHALCNCTKKELRQAHNLEKMYRAGTFAPTEHLP